MAYGYVVSPTPEEAVSIRCVVLVNGFEVSSTNPAAGTTTAVTAGRITYTASETDHVEVCPGWSAGDEGDEIDCPASIPIQFPPQEFWDLVDNVLSITGPETWPVCEVLQGWQPGVPGVVDIGHDGDVAVAGVPLWECPPYESYTVSNATDAAMPATVRTASSGVLRFTSAVAIGPSS